MLVLILDAKGQVVLSVRFRPRHQDAHPYAEVVRCRNSTFRVSPGDLVPPGTGEVEKSVDCLDMIGEGEHLDRGHSFSFLTCYSVYICLRHRKMESKRCLGWPSRSGEGTTGIWASLPATECPGSVVLSVALEHPRFRRNRTERSATFQMIGPDRGGALWTICIVETILRGRWRAVTGWPSEAGDKAWYERSEAGH